MHFQPGEKGDHFFQSTLVQTLFYGLFSAWAAHARESAGPFDWRTAAWTLQVPAIRTLFEQVATPGRLGTLGLIDVLGWAADALNRVDTETFFSEFDEANAVQHFYEPFLAAYDPDLRRAWVSGTRRRRLFDTRSRVDRTLRDELGIADGWQIPTSGCWTRAREQDHFWWRCFGAFGERSKRRASGPRSARNLKRRRPRIAGFEVLRRRS